MNHLVNNLVIKLKVEYIILILCIDYYLVLLKEEEEILYNITIIVFTLVHF
jgi:hypothetical protein